MTEVPAAVAVWFVTDPSSDAGETRRERCGNRLASANPDVFFRFLAPPDTQVGPMTSSLRSCIAKAQHSRRVEENLGTAAREAGTRLDALTYH